MSTSGTQPDKEMGMMEIDQKRYDKDFFLKEGPKTDFRLIVEGRDIWIPSGFVGIHSEFFRCLCSNDKFKEAQERKAELPGKTFDAVLAFMEVLVPHPDTKKINVESYQLIVPLAWEWRVNSVRELCCSLLLQLLSTPFNHKVNWFQLLQPFSSFPVAEIPKNLITGFVAKAVVGMTHQTVLEKFAEFNINAELQILAYRVLLWRADNQAVVLPMHTTQILPQLQSLPPEYLRALNDTVPDLLTVGTPSCDGCRHGGYQPCASYVFCHKCQKHLCRECAKDETCINLGCKICQRSKLCCQCVPPFSL